MHATSKTHKNLALFDFDGTLCKKDSFTGFIFYALSKRHIVKQGIKILPWIQAYYLKVYPADAMRPKLFKAMFKDADADEILELAEEYSTRLMAQLDPAIYQQLLIHQENGDDVVLVSASIDIYLEAICQILNIDLICTGTEIKNGLFTGSYSTLDCSCDQKRLRVLEKYDLNQYNKIYAYGNSEEDLDMLSLADFKYMVGVNSKLPYIKEEKKFA
ncbi:HAD-IB family hydrolase [Acinetobacter sichuanensis]|uniref:HAD-IB family hydrolase n=1 Tax=Acinetobacter sichuanensis TaxID=2136183 RepID=UPI00280E7FE1|nr:HAD-IB family hydrolase [Acinetobacter sichuanensis]MDQ9022242.1 HAD-IB family hydrolase [Acinetobacter sichuanensis]